MSYPHVRVSAHGALLTQEERAAIDRQIYYTLNTATDVGPRITRTDTREHEYGVKNERYPMLSEVRGRRVS